MPNATVTTLPRIGTQFTFAGHGQPLPTVATVVTARLSRGAVEAVESTAVLLIVADGEPLDDKYAVLYADIDGDGPQLRAVRTVWHYELDEALADFKF